jgi:hypothetical protein
MSNENESKSERNRLPVDKTLFVNGVAQESGALVKNVDGIAFHYVEEGSEPVNLATVNLSDLSADVRNTLAIVGLRYFGQLAMQGADKEADETNEDLVDILSARLSERFASIKDGSFSERGGERGANLLTIAKVISVVKGLLKVSEAKEATVENPIVSERLANLKKMQTEFASKDDPKEPGKLFGEWLKKLRTRKEYRDAAREMFPRKAGPGRKPTINTADMIEGL